MWPGVGLPPLGLVGGRTVTRVGKHCGRGRSEAAGKGGEARACGGRGPQAGR